MLKRPIAFISLVILTLLANSQGGLAQAETKDACFEFANRTYNLLNQALEGEQQAHLKKFDQRDSEDDLSGFSRKDFIGDPQTSLTRAMGSIDAASEQLNAAGLAQCLGEQTLTAVQRTLSDARKIDGFLRTKLGNLGGAPVDMTAAAYTTFLGKTIELKKSVLGTLIVADFGGG